MAAFHFSAYGTVHHVLLFVMDQPGITLLPGGNEYLPPLELASSSHAVSALPLAFLLTGVLRPCDALLWTLVAFILVVVHGTATAATGTLNSSFIGILDSSATRVVLES